MEEYQKVTYAPMNEEERSKVKKAFLFIVFFALLSGTVFYFLFKLTHDIEPFFWGLCGIAILFSGILLYATWAAMIDLRDNEKAIVQGVVTMKRTFRSTGKRRRTSYYLYFGKKSMRVRLELYNKFKEGDLIEIHKAKRTYNIIFKTELLKQGLLKEKIAEQREKHNKRGKVLRFLTIPICLSIVVVVLTLLFWKFSECFHCPIYYPESVTLWKEYRSLATKEDPVQLAGEKTITLFNNALLDEEEKLIKEQLFELTMNQQINDYLSYLDSQYPNNGNELTALQWLKLKFDEAKFIRRPLSVVEMWKRVLYNIISLEAMRPSYTFNKNETTFHDVTIMVLTDKNITYQSTKAWFGKNETVKTLQNDLKGFIPQDTSHYSRGVNQLMKEVWSTEFQMDNKYLADYQRAQELYFKNK
ncbi:MAG: hypothetical protein RIG77_25625 [Cyclobacteriaceae bacterium]